MDEIRFFYLLISDIFNFLASIYWGTLVVDGLNVVLLKIKMIQFQGNKKKRRDGA